MQSRKYADKDEIAFVADFPGADPEDDVVIVRLDDAELDVTDRADRELGEVSLTEAVETALDDALESVGDDALVVTTDDALDVSSETVTIAQEETLDVSQTGNVKVVPMRPVELADTSPATASTSSTGSGEAATIALGALRKDVDIFYDVSGSATITIEVRRDGGTWRSFRELSIEAAEADIVQMDTAFAEVRVYADQNLNTIEISGKGV